ncbi:hypothetical protein A2415_05395 [candidate division WWE3 bacterium RIFOXYC1_FULL_39_7]|uniref:GerMN domain-containing protein n=2 Tax=Katanobacteria TaxID=422282 RepID=A0A1F4X9Q7_UNCKA|nr:MAG: hypothetical protein A2415_05395 [candidate division WWE3 bacterium RIFOXYC1_FULL_39_7]OGC78412.1 MAG: hypothetical protein A2619_00915 [candidate division WWE3 bacterium RIFOXYD1_FULL_39_9]
MEPQVASKKPIIIFLIILAITAAVSYAFYKWYYKEYAPLTDTRLEETLGKGEQGPLNDAFVKSDDAKPGTNEVLVYYVDIENKRGAKTEIGCGDSLLPVSVSSLTEGKDTSELVTIALSILFGEKDQFIGKGALYNTLYQSNLKVERVEIDQGIAKVYLTGEMKLGGVCDNPRLEGQVEYTTQQFEGVRHAELYLNGAPLDLSQK